MDPLESTDYSSDTDKSLPEASPQTIHDLLLADADEKTPTKALHEPCHQPNLLERLGAAKNRFFERLVGIPEVKVSKDHTAQVHNSMEYEVLFEKTTGPVCTLFYRGSDENDKKMKDEAVELARSLSGTATFALVDADTAKDFVRACALAEKLPAFALADKKYPYIHLYMSRKDTTSFKELIDRYERGELKLED